MEEKKNVSSYKNKKDNTKIISKENQNKKQTTNQPR